MTIQWYQYEVTIRPDDRIVGGIPIVPEGEDRADVYEKWARGQAVEQDPGYEEPLHAALAAEEDMPVAVATEDVEGMETGFRRSEELGLYIEARQIKAMLRESAQRLGLIKKKRGLRQVVQHDLHVSALDGTQKIALDRQEPDGRDQRPISVVTRQGPRTAVKRFEYVTQPEITFLVRVLAGGIGDGLVGEDELRDMLELGQELGLGADRSQGEGKFTVVSVAAAD